MFRLRRTFLGLWIDFGPGIDEEFHTGEAGALDGSHERRAVVEGLCVDVGPGIHQKLHNFQISPVGRVVEGRPEELVTDAHVSPVGRKVGVRVQWDLITYWKDAARQIERCFWIVVKSLNGFTSKMH